MLLRHPFRQVTEYSHHWPPFHVIFSFPGPKPEGRMIQRNQVLMLTSSYPYVNRSLTTALGLLNFFRRANTHQRLPSGPFYCLVSNFGIILFIWVRILGTFSALRHLHTIGLHQSSPVASWSVHVSNWKIWSGKRNPGNSQWSDLVGRSHSPCHGTANGQVVFSVESAH